MLVFHRFAANFAETKSIMKKIIFSAVIALAFLTSCGNSEKSKPASDSTAIPTATVPAGGTQIAAVKYQCPMKCENEKTYDKAGKCPMCQMDMKEVK
jgi:hypothetical protein